MNNRELAGIIWLGVVFSYAFTREGGRSGIASLMRGVAQPKVLTILLLMGVYVAGLIFLGSQIGLWTPSLLGSSVAWFVGTGMVMLFRMERVYRDDRFFLHTCLWAIRATVFVEVFVNLYVFSLIFELILLPALAALALISTVAAADKDLTLVKKLADGVLSLAGVGLLIYVSARLVIELNAANGVNELRTFFLPVWLTVSAMPFIFFLGLWSSYEIASIGIDIATQDRRQRWIARLALARGLRLSASNVQAFSHYWAGKLVEATSFADARAVVDEFRASQEAAAHAAADEQDRLVRNAGMDGADAEGRRLDQREFAETRKALQWIATAQMGWYERDGHYRPDLVAILEPFDGLPAEHGIALAIARGGRSWWAWRRTVSGWCFAIGATDPPPDQWLFDGTDPPSGAPTENDSWGGHWGVDALNW
jgi:hypothetical protein